jgi:hypothetical protein
VPIPCRVLCPGIAPCLWAALRTRELERLECLQHALAFGRLAAPADASVLARDGDRRTPECLRERAGLAFDDELRAKVVELCAQVFEHRSVVEAGDHSVAALSEEPEGREAAHVFHSGMLCGFDFGFAPLEALLEQTPQMLPGDLRQSLLSACR